MVQWQNHMVGARTKTIRRGTISHLQIPSLQPPKQQTETPIAHRCPPHATAPSPALRPNLSLRPPSTLTPPWTRNQWCPRAQKGGWHTAGLLYRPSPGRACLSPRPPNPETTAPNSPSNTDCRQGLARHSLTETVRKNALSSLLIRIKLPNKLWDANSLSFSSASRSSQDGPFCEVRPGCSDGHRWLYSFLQLYFFWNIKYTKKRLQPVSLPTKFITWEWLLICNEGIVLHFGECAYSLACWELDEKTHSTRTSVR